MHNFPNTITADLNNLILSGSEYPIIMANIYDALIPLQKRSFYLKYLEIHGFLEQGFSTEVKLVPTSDTEQTLTAIKQVATQSFIKTTPITSISTTPYFDNTQYYKYTIPKFRATTHVTAQTTEDLLQSNTFSTLADGMAFYTRKRFNTLTSHVGLIVRWKDTILGNIFQGNQTFNVETYDGTGTVNTTTKTYALDTSITSNIANTISLQTVQSFENASTNARLSEVGEPIIWITSQRPFELLYREYTKGTGLNEAGGAQIRYMDPEEVQKHSGIPRWIKTGHNSFIYETSLDESQFTYNIDSLTTPTTASRYGAAVITKRAIGTLQHLPTRFETNVMHNPDPLRRGYLSEEMGIYNVEQTKSSAATGNDLTYLDFKSSTVWTFCPDQFNLAGLFTFAISSTTPTDGGIPYDFTGNVVADVTNAIAAYQASVGSRIQNTQQRMGSDAGTMEMDSFMDTNSNAPFPKMAAKAM